jgi:hypothetical protein
MNNRLRKAVLSIAAIVALAGCASPERRENLVVAKADFVVSADAARAAALTTLHESLSEGRYGNIRDFDTANPVIATARDGRGRLFTFVGFRHLRDAGGFSAIFEKCPGQITSFLPSFFGDVGNLQDDFDGFLKVSGNVDADYPDACHCNDD